MNRRPALLTTIAVTTALTLTACGSEEPDTAAKDSDKAKGTKASASSSPSTSAGRPKIELPADLKLTFEGGETGDPVKDAILTDNAERMRAVDAAITGTDLEGKALAFYNTGKALKAAQDWVAQFEEAGATITGEARYYEREVTLKGEDSAALTFCADESKGFSKDKKTNEIHKTPVTKNSYVLYNTRLDKNADGVWQTSQIISNRGAAQCQP
ncbi:hypothetical protein QWL27_19705 [Streptomyces thermocarboxydus]|uniref:hypothetical protein n=1 Tax=Streptomyces thermocarboxydus TaxID=59299 RepID=UPI0025C74C99|nr:hypothetical protein [Streptomyces thermocarboxydus]